MKLSEYDGKYVRVIDKDGNSFSGLAEYGTSEFLECEWGLDEDGIFIEDVIICNSQIASIEEISFEKCKNLLKEKWQKEEDIAYIHGWDFSHIKDRYEEEDDLPWDFGCVIQKYLKDSMSLLDMDTGGGEFLLSLNHPYENTAAIEGYPPNVELCKEVLLPLGIDFKESYGESDKLPFDDESFDIVTNRHGSFKVDEIKRVLKPDGLFLTQQVGAENDRELVNLLLPQITELPFPDEYLSVRVKEFEEHNFEVLERGEIHRPIRFYDVGALVWFARIIEWEFPGFSVENCLEQLYKAQKIIEDKGVIEGSIHRFYIVAKKK